jgi:hypothetical protein
MNFFCVIVSRSFLRFTKPGGWVEFMDFTMTFYTVNGEFKPGCAVDRWTKELKEFFVSFGLEPEPGPKLKGWIEDAGFKNIHEKRMALPVGMWPKGKRMVRLPFLSCYLLLTPISSRPANREIVLMVPIEGDWDCQLDPVS